MRYTNLTPCQKHNFHSGLSPDALGTMKTTTPARKIAFQKVGQNLYRLESTGGYYALLKRADKQFRRSLKTKDRKLAERKLSELREKVCGLTTGEKARVGDEFTTSNG